MAELKTYMAPGHARIIRLEAQVAELEATMREQRTRLQAASAMTLRPLGVRRTFYRRVMTRKLLSYPARPRRPFATTSSNEMQTQAGRSTNHLLQKVKEAGVSKAMRVGNVRLVEPAQAPLKPYRPRVLTNAFMGLMAGLFLAIAFVALRERVDYNIRVPGESPACLRVPELGAVPSAESGETLMSVLMPPGIVRSAGASRPAIAASSGELSPVADSFRAILASLLFSPRNAVPSIAIVITSAGPGEGKSTVISNLGLAMAETGRRVLLIDGDLRSPRLHEIFGIGNREGLAELLSEDLPPESLSVPAIRITPSSGLYVLPAGNTSGNISHLLYSTRFSRLLKRFREEFDEVLIDSPPMLQAPDARVLARVAGAVVLVIRAGKTSRDTASAARQRFAEDGTLVIGTILNDWNAKESSGPRYQKYPNRNGHSGSNGRA